MNLLSFLTTSAIMALIPGTGVIFTISTGIIKGKKASLYAALGCTLGIIPHLILSIIFSSLLLQIGSPVFHIIKIAGVLYLFYLGIRMFLFNSSINLSFTTNQFKPFTIIKQAVFINLLNPKLTIFFFSFFPQYISIDEKSYLLQSLFLGFLFMSLTLLIFLIYGLLAGGAAKFIQKSTHIVNILQKVFGFIFILFAIQLLLQRMY